MSILSRVIDDRFPKARLLLGHMGEALPYLLWRFDSRAKLYGVKLAQPPSHYIKRNIWVTVSGVFAAEPLYCAVGALGRERVMFAADYPFENAEEAGHFMDTVPLDAELRSEVAYGNAAKLLGLSARGGKAHARETISLPSPPVGEGGSRGAITSANRGRGAASLLNSDPSPRSLRSRPSPTRGEGYGVRGTLEITSPGSPGSACRPTSRECPRPCGRRSACSSRP